MNQAAAAPTTAPTAAPIPAPAGALVCFSCAKSLAPWFSDERTEMSVARYPCFCKTSMTSVTVAFFAILVFLLLEVCCGPVHEPGQAVETAAMRAYGAEHHAQVQDLPAQV